jgi:hypothetical protein
VIGPVGSPLTGQSPEKTEKLAKLKNGQNDRIMVVGEFHV